MSGQATRGELEDLHRLLLETLMDRLSGPRRTGVDQLAVARIFLADNGFKGQWAMDAKTQRRLQKLYAALCAQFVKAASEEHPSPKLIGELRAFLHSQGIDKDCAAVADKAAVSRAAALLGGLDLPFVTR